MARAKGEGKRWKVKGHHSWAPVFHKSYYVLLQGEKSHIVYNDKLDFGVAEFLFNSLHLLSLGIFCFIL